ncbi:MAG: DUF3592 domain-containing protein [Thermoguttaceae bacterium]|nr:DUF3592 domain-containing protein [Thermoguttaceae bacterium]
MSAERPDAIESPLNVPQIDPNEPLTSAERQFDAQGRPFVVVDGRRYVLAEDEPDVDLASLPENPKLAELPPVPRDVSTTAKLVLLFGSTATSTFGWFWLCFSMIFVVVFFGTTRVGTALLDRGATWEPFAIATLVACDDGNVEINGRSAYRWKFAGQAPDGSYFEGVSHSFAYREPGQLVAVEKKAGTTDVLRAEGTSTAPFGDSLGSLFFVATFPFLSIFLFIGVCLAIIGPVRRGLRTIPLLRSGAPAQGVPVDVSPTGTWINGRDEMEVTYRFQAVNGAEFETSARGLNIDRLTDDPAEVLLYDPENPKRTVVLDELPKSVKTVPGKGFTARPFGLIFPLIGAVVCLAEVGYALKLSFQTDRAVFSTEPPTAAAQFDPSAALNCPDCESGTPHNHSQHVHTDACDHSHDAE